MTFTFEIIILIFAILANIFIVSLAYIRNPKSATNRLLVALGIALTAWSAINFLSVKATSEEDATLLVRLVMACSVPIGVFFLILMHTFPHSVLKISRKTFWGAMGLMVITMIVALSPLLFPKVELLPGHAPQPTPGIGMLLYVPVVIGSIVYGIYLIIRKFAQARGIERVQTAYVLIGVVAMFVLIICLNFIAVNAFGVTTYITYGPVFTLPFTLLTTYAIIRYRLLDIRTAIFRSLSLSFLVGGVLGVYGLLVVFAVPILSNVTGIGVQFLAAGAALVSIPIAQFVQRALIRATDKLLFQSRVDYGEALTDISRDLSATIDITEATNVVLHAMTQTMRARKAIVLLRDPGTGLFEPQGSRGVKDFHITINPDNELLKHLQHTQNILVKDELVLEKETESSEAHKQEINTILNALEWVDVTVILPLVVNKELTGLIFLGEKLSGTPYLKGDIEFLTTFAAQAGVNLENARLYKESLAFGKKLEQEVRRATQELESANMQLKNLDKAKSEFLSIASHQLRTPLTALRGYVSMIKEGDFGEVPEQQKPVLDILDKSATRLIDLINSLLDISRIESGRLELNLESVDLAEMANELVRDLIPNAVTKKLGLEFHQPKEMPAHVVVDKQRIRQVMLNFIDNAIKYTEKGRVDVYVAQEGDQVVFWVEDTGKGISKDDLARLFNKFTRVGGSSRFHTEGTGLGLYVARQIVKEHRGEVHVDSEGEGKGSTFAMNLPAEGTPNSLKPGEKAEVTIKAAEAQK